MAGGVLNMVLDYVFIALFDMGIGGAAVATGMGYPSGVWYCAWHFGDLVFYLVQDCGKDISETGYCLMDI